MHHAIDKHTGDYPQHQHNHSYSSSSTDSAELKTDIRTDEMIAAPAYELDPDMMGMLTSNWNLNTALPGANWGFQPVPADAPALYDPDKLMARTSNHPAPLSESTMITPLTNIMDTATSEPDFGSGGSIVNNNSRDPFIGMDSGFVIPNQECAILPALYDGGATYKPQHHFASVNGAGMNQFVRNNQLEESSNLSSNGAPQPAMTVGSTFQGPMDGNVLFNEMAQPPAAINGFAILQDNNDIEWNGSSSSFATKNAILQPTSPTPPNVITQPVPSRVATPSITSKDGTKKPKRIRRLCSVAGCGKRARSQDLCIAHGGGRRCMVEGCEKSSQGGNRCIKHGGGKRCKHPRCDKAAQTNTLCKAHGGGPRCQFPGCSKSSQGGGFCRSHGGGKRCAAQGCNKGTQRGDFCALHGGSRFCEVPDCMRNDRGGGLCAHHGGGKRCTISNCNRSCRRNGLCSTHLRLLGHAAGDNVSSVLTPATMSSSTDVSSV